MFIKSPTQNFQETFALTSTACCSAAKTASTALSGLQAVPIGREILLVTDASSLAMLTMEDSPRTRSEFKGSNGPPRSSGSRLLDAQLLAPPAKGQAGAGPLPPHSLGGNDLLLPLSPPLPPQADSPWECPGREYSLTLWMSASAQACDLTPASPQGRRRSRSRAG
jgi:hypothetical protein